MTPLLVIGYGNELRGDDGAGPRVARRLAAMALPGVRTIAVHQLTPELTDDLANAERVLFVDAAATATESVSWRSLDPSASAMQLGHLSDPDWLLTLVQATWGRVPAAWLATITAQNLDHGFELTLAVEQAVDRLVSEIVTWVTRSDAVGA